MENYHLVYKDEQWKLEKEHAERASINFGNQGKATAVKESTAFLSKGSGGSLKIHKLDGTIQEERTYPRSADPTKSKG